MTRFAAWVGPRWAESVPREVASGRTEVRAISRHSIANAKYASPPEARIHQGPSKPSRRAEFDPTATAWERDSARRQRTVSSLGRNRGLAKGSEDLADMQPRHRRRSPVRPPIHIDVLTTVLSLTPIAAPCPQGATAPPPAQSLFQKQRLVLRRLLRHAKGLEGCSRRRRTAPSGTSFEASPDQVRGSRRLRTREPAFGSSSQTNFTSVPVPLSGARVKLLFE